MSQKSRIITVFVALVIIGGSLIGASVANDNTHNSTNPAQSQQKKIETVSYKGVTGKSALELLKSTYDTETKTYDGLGEMVTSIDGVIPDAKHFWALYVNDKLANVGASQYQTMEGDRITWKLDAIQ